MPKAYPVMVDDIVYPSISAAARVVGFSADRLHDVLQRGTQKYKGHQIEYMKPQEKENVIANPRTSYKTIDDFFDNQDKVHYGGLLSKTIVMQ